jgi:hypothetical protein
MWLKKWVYIHYRQCSFDGFGANSKNLASKHFRILMLGAILTKK